MSNRRLPILVLTIVFLLLCPVPTVRAQEPRNTCGLPKSEEQLLKEYAPQTNPQTVGYQFGSLDDLGSGCQYGIIQVAFWDYTKHGKDLVVTHLTFFAQFTGAEWVISPPRTDITQSDIYWLGGKKDPRTSNTTFFFAKVIGGLQFYAATLDLNGSVELRSVSPENVPYELIVRSREPYCGIWAQFELALKAEVPSNASHVNALDFHDLSNGNCEKGYAQVFVDGPRIGFGDPEYTTSATFFFYRLNGELVISEPIRQDSGLIYYYLRGEVTTDGAEFQIYFIGGPIEVWHVDPEGNIEKTQEYLVEYETLEGLSFAQQKSTRSWPSYFDLIPRLTQPKKEIDRAYVGTWKCLSRGSYDCSLAFTSIYWQWKVTGEQESWGDGLYFFAQKTSKGWKIAQPLIVANGLIFYNLTVQPSPDGFILTGCSLDNVDHTLVITGDQVTWTEEPSATQCAGEEPSIP